MFTLEFERYESITVARFVGNMTLENAVELRQQLEQVLKETKAKDLILDLAVTQKVDTSGLGALVGACTSARAWGKRLMLYRLPPHITKILEQSEISGFFPILEDEDDLKARQHSRT